MMLRLAMVGIVAALGITIPSQTECDKWLTASQRWASSAFAEWDGWRPQERVGDPVSDESDVHECEQCRLARLALVRGEEHADAGTTVVESASSTTVAGSAVTDERAERADNIATPAPLSSVLPSASLHVLASDGFTVGNTVELTWNVDGNDVAESPAPLAGSQARAEWAAVSAKLDAASSSERWARLGDNDGRRWRKVVAISAPQKAGTAVPGSLGSTATDEEDQPAEWLSAFEFAPEAEVVPSDPSMRESSPEAEAMEWLEPVACEIGEWLADRQSVPSASPVSALAGGDGTKRGADNPAPMSPGKDTLPVASDVTATTAEATTVPAAALPWPVFSAPEPVAETATEIVQETTVPWPVFAPAGTNGGPVGAVALNTSRPCEASDLAGLSSPREVASDSPVVRDGQPFRPTGRVASILPENPRDQSAACAQPVWGDAVRLTRQAVSAWVNVLTRPTRVEITAR